MKKIIVWFIIMMFFISGKAMAGEGGNAPLLSLDTIVVTAAKYEKLLKDVPQNVTVIGEEELKEKKGKTLGEILQDAAGLQVQPQGGIGSLSSTSMRGMRSSQVLVMVDGRPINKFQDGMVDLSSIPVENIASIEIVRGAASSLYGSNAMGGVVNIITKKAADDSVNISYGTFNTSHSDFTVSNEAGNFVYTITAAKDASKGDRPNSFYDAENINWYSGYKVSDDFSLDLRAGYFNSRSGLPGQVTSATPNDKQFDKNNYADLEINLPYGVMLKGYTKYDTLNVEWDDWFGVKQFSDHKNRETGSEIKVSRKLADWNHLVAGAEYRDYSLRSSEIGSRKMDLSSGYLQDEIKLSDSALITLGGRYDSYKGIDPEFSPSAAILFHITNDTALRLSAGKSFRAPGFNDLYWPSTLWAEGNPNLTPETAVSYDVGIDTQFSNDLWFRVSGFYSEVEDMINWAEGIDFVWRPYNVDSAKIKGFEAEIKAKFLKYVTLDIDYTSLDTENEETKKDIIYRPDNKVDAKLNVRNEKTSFTLALEYVGKRYQNEPDINGTRIRLREYTIYHANISHDVSDAVQLYLKGENIFDKEYSFNKDYPMPGEAVYAGMKVKF
jgi:outer membrane cobalamin receptor